jgi:nitrous oxidase accessory protein NosD
MKNSLLSISTALVFLLLQIVPGHAQATRTWVSGVGDDANPCSRTAPCKTFAGAISKTAANGEINCIDPGGFGAVTITKAITISCESVEAGVLVAGTNGIIVSAGANDIVVLRGLDLVGAGSGLDGIKFNAGAALHVEKCTIRGFTGSPGNGIHFAPSATSQLSVVNTTITDNNKSSTSAGILIQPTGTGLATAVIKHSSLINNGNGLIVDGSQTTTTSELFASISESIASGNAMNGVKGTSAAGKAPTRIVVSHLTVTGNATGISSTGQGSDITLGYSNVNGNTTGVSFTAPAELRTYQTNQVRGNNVTNGTFSSTIPLE